MHINEITVFQAGDIVQCVTQDLNYRLFYRVIEPRGDMTFVLQDFEIHNGQVRDIVPNLTASNVSERTWPIELPTKDLAILWRQRQS